MTSINPTALRCFSQSQLDFELSLKTFRPFPLSRCVCDAGEIGDGWRCYANLMDRLIELNSGGSQRENLTGAVALFGKRTTNTL